MKHGDVYVFINLEQAAGFGHIGWGFQTGTDSYYFGSTDHLWNTDYPLWHPLELIRYMNVQPKVNNDFWAQTGTLEEMLRVMRAGRHVKYHVYKQLPVRDGQPEAARSLADGMEAEGWNVIFNNCVHQTFRVLTAYGAELPNPQKFENRIPKGWFNAIESPAQELAAPTNIALAQIFEPKQGQETG